MSALRWRFCLVVALLLSLGGLALCSEGPAPTATTFFPVSAAAFAPEASFFSVIPANGDYQVIETPAAELAQIAVTSVNSDVPLDAWTRAGWGMGKTLGPTEAVPLDCLLHARQGTGRQVYALCPGGSIFTVPNTGADFIYVILMDQQHRIQKMLQTGKLYTPDVTGLMP